MVARGDDVDGTYDCAVLGKLRNEVVRDFARATGVGSANGNDDRAGGRIR